MVSQYGPHPTSIKHDREWHQVPSTWNRRRVKGEGFTLKRWGMKSPNGLHGLGRVICKAHRTRNLNRNLTRDPSHRICMNMSTIHPSSIIEKQSQVLLNWLVQRRCRRYVPISIDTDIAISILHWYSDTNHPAVTICLSISFHLSNVSWAGTYIRRTCNPLKWAVSPLYISNYM